MGIIPLFYAQFNSPNPFLTNGAFCKVRVYVNQLGAMSCRWLLVMACIDRCLTCSIHARFRHAFTVASSRRIAVGLILVWMIIPMHTLIFVDIVPPGNIACIVINSDVAMYHGLYTLILGGVLPPTVMLICTIFIWLSLKRKNQRQTTIVLASGNVKNTHRDQQVIIILLAQVALFVISTIPFMANNFYANLTRGITNKPPDRMAIEGFAGVITEVFVYIFPASTFYCNTLVSRTFRHELCNMFKWLHPRPHHISPTTQTRSQGISLDVIAVNQTNPIFATSTTTKVTDRDN